jgi:protocatechuate 3,4-dioxygenase, beta subunit
MKKTPFIFLFAILSLALGSCYSQAPNDKKSEIQLTGNNEPGKALHLDIVVLDISTKKPVAGVEVFVYHTNNKGDYERDEKDVARIHGTVYSDAQGKIRIHTIYPRGYNDSPNGAHIHFQVKAKGYETNNNAEIMFDEYKGNKYDRNNLKTSVVYVDELSEQNNVFTGKATMYVQKK